MANLNHSHPGSPNSPNMCWNANVKTSEGFLSEMFVLLPQFHFDSALKPVGWQVCKSISADRLHKATQNCEELRLLQLVHHTALYVAAFFAEIWVFFDYVSLFQFSRETEAQRASFDLAMANMHVLYAHEMSVTLRIESLTPAERWSKAIDEDEVITVFHAKSSVVKSVLIKDLKHNPTPYNNRGWCIGEMEWSSDRQETAQNQLIDICRDSAGQDHWDDAPKLLGRVPTSPEHFAEKLDIAAFTHRESDAPIVVNLQKKIFLEKVRRNESLNVEGLPRSEFQQLLRALPYFEVLQTITLIHFECSQEEAEAFAKVGF